MGCRTLVLGRVVVVVVAVSAGEEEELAAHFQGLPDRPLTAAELVACQERRTSAVFIDAVQDIIITWCLRKVPRNVPNRPCPTIHRFGRCEAVV